MEDNIYEEKYVKEQQHKLDNILRHAMFASNGDEFFHEYSYKPLTSMFITTGELIEGDGREHELHTHLIEQHSGYPPHIDSYEDIIKKGYQLFCENNDLNTKKLTEFGCTSLNIVEYKEMFCVVKGIIDRAIDTNHGIKCFADGDLNNMEPDNMYYMHICDIFNIMIHEYASRRIRLLIETSLLPYITPQMKHMLEERLLNCRQYYFLLNNVDIFYMSYGYYFNTSFVPIRTRIPTQSGIFKMSCFFMNDEHFVQHQRGKLKEIDQIEDDYINRILYRTFKKKQYYLCKFYV
jgi:hypothetical protein